MNYDKVYEKLIANHGSWLKQKGVYTERHRKLPGYLGGKYVKGNAFYVSARVHYLCHLLWAKATNDGPAWCAVKFMGEILRRHGSKMYQKAKIEHARITGERTKGKRYGLGYKHVESFKTRLLGNKFALGYTHSEETKRKISEANIGNTHMLGRKMSLETRMKMSKASLGKPKSEAARINMKKARNKYADSLRSAERE